MSIIPDEYFKTGVVVDNEVNMVIRGHTVGDLEYESTRKEYVSNSVSYHLMFIWS